ncbi:SCO1664 family protein [Streptomyces sp. SBT349]|uniref:SCO1664 family protein n=1 Tax=Streptomyces sp. SBT349 TaxID=1580539 RepID=UPI00066DB488|nr:SCO1664 family protein [Streptomyces sp. SBT349]
MSASERIPAQPDVTADEVLARGELTVHGQITDASNTVLYATAELDGRSVACVYKPVAGERPLWDFPEGTLAQREVAAYEVSRALGFGVVPPTVLREGPFGTGMCQLWVGDGPDAEAEGEGGPGTEGVGEPGGPGSFLALIDAREPEPGWKAVGFAEVGAGRTALLVHTDDERLRRVATLDAVINNADRKGGRLLPLADGRLYGIDHGVTFHTENKLRTLLWGWAGEPLPEGIREALRALGGQLADEGPLYARLRALITEEECEALRSRTAALVATGRFPAPGGKWPAIPWPLV